MNVTITVEDILKHKPCEGWPEERIREHIGDGKTLIDVLNDTSVDADDRIWCVTRFLPDTINRRFAADCALHVAHMWDMPPVVREYLETLDDDLKEKACASAYAAAAAYAAARAAARDAAYAAARDAAYAAAYAAARAAARDAAYAAARDAARAAEKDWQINRLIELIGGEK